MGGACWFREGGKQGNFWDKGSRGDEVTEKRNQIYVQDPVLCDPQFSSCPATQLDVPRDMLNVRGPSAYTRSDDHRVPRLLLNDITAVLHNWQG